MDTHEHYFCCKGTLDAGNCPEIAFTLGEATGAATLPAPVGLIAPEIPATFVAPEIEPGEYLLTCSLGHTYFYRVGVDLEVKREALKISKAPIAPISPLVDKAYWLKRGHALIDDAHTRLVGQVKSLNTFLDWLTPTIPFTTSVAAVLLKLQSPGAYVLLAVPSLLVFIAHALGSLAQIPGAVVFDPINWYQSKEAQETIVKKTVRWLRLAKFFSIAATVATGIAIIGVTYYQQQELVLKEETKKHVSENESLQKDRERLLALTLGHVRSLNQNGLFKLDGQFPNNEVVSIRMYRKGDLVADTMVIAGPTGAIHFERTTKDTLDCSVLYKGATGKIIGGRIGTDKHWSGQP